MPTYGYGPFCDRIGSCSIFLCYMSWAFTYMVNVSGWRSDHGTQQQQQQPQQRCPWPIPIVPFRSKAHVACRSRPKRILLLVPNENDLSPTYNRLIIVASLPPSSNLRARGERGGGGLPILQSLSWPTGRHKGHRIKERVCVCPNSYYAVTGIHPRLRYQFNQNLDHCLGQECFILTGTRGSGAGGSSLATNYANKICDVIGKAVSGRCRIKGACRTTQRCGES